MSHPFRVPGMDPPPEPEPIVGPLRVGMVLRFHGGRDWPRHKSDRTENIDERWIITQKIDHPWMHDMKEPASKWYSWHMQRIWPDTAQAMNPREAYIRECFSPERDPAFIKLWPPNIPRSWWSRLLHLLGRHQVTTFKGLRAHECVGNDCILGLHHLKEHPWCDSCGFLDQNEFWR